MAESKPISGLLLEKLDTNRIASAILKHASESENEEDIKIRFEDELREVLKGWGIEWASYEHRLKISGREDSLYGSVIIEYKTPGRLDSKTEYSKAKEQIKGYIEQQAGTQSRYGKYFGVLTDGYKIAFIRYRKNEWLEQAEPLSINGQTILRLVESIRGLRRKPIDAEQLLLDFGPRSETSRRVILVFYNAIADKNVPRTDMLFNDWRRVFSQVCAYSPEKFARLVTFYGLMPDKKVDVEKLLFAIHTYYTLLMKLLTSEIVTLFADSLLGSYLKRIEEAFYRGKDELLVELKDLEEGGIFSSLGIRNFLEADYFAWYLDEWNDDIAKATYEISKKLLDYEPATVELNPERVEDLFKRLYQNLVPRDVRHSIGEYFTPDWLAELVLDEAGYNGNPDLRVLDPACGSGTFIVLAIRKVRDYAEQNYVDSRELLSKITSNIRGVDLNPLAVLASRANYLIALSDLLRYRPREGMDIPIFLADSISVVRRVTPYGEDEFELQTNEGKFWVTKEVIDNNVLQPVLGIINEGVKVGLRKQEFEISLGSNIPLRKDSVQSLIRLYDKILTLERLGKDRIWTSLLKNSFSPMLLGKFDYVVGNPPWINWEYLPEYYRSTTKELWSQYGLLEKTKGMGLGKISRDIAMLFVARCMDSYLREDGRLAFLIPFTAFKTQAGAGFREFLSKQTEVQAIYDLVELYPFEGATNRTALLVAKHGKTSFPVRCMMWGKKSGSTIAQEDSLPEVMKATTRAEMIFSPLETNSPKTSWMIMKPQALQALRKVLGSSNYRAYRGVYSGATSVFWLKVLSKEPLLVENSVTAGKIKSRTVRMPFEHEVLYTMLRGRDVKKWYAKQEFYMPVPADKGGKPIPLSQMRLKYPKAYSYFNTFFAELIKRMGEPYKSLLRPYREKKRETAEREAPPFYMLFNIEHNLEQAKVVWKYISGKISGKAELSAAVIEPEGEKPVIADNSLIFIPLKSVPEAHYVAAIINSTPVRLVAASYSVETHISTHIAQNVAIPKFDLENRIHKRLSDLSKEAHVLSVRAIKNGDAKAEESLKKLEVEIDSNVAEIFGISSSEMDELSQSLDLLRGENEEASEEEDED